MKSSLCTVRVNRDSHAVSRLLPLIPQERRYSGHLGIHTWCQDRTPAVQQKNNPIHLNKPI